MVGGLAKAWKATGQDVISEEIWLLGQPPLQDFLDIIERNAAEPVDRKALYDEWRQANDHYYALSDSEAGIADRAECLDLDHALEPQATEVMETARFRRAFDTLPVRFGMVELEKLVVYQKHVTRPFVDALRDRLGPAPDPQAVFRFCLPLGCPDVPVRVQRINSQRYIFSSESTDFRLGEIVLLDPARIGGYEGFGAVAGVLGTIVGFGSNFLHVTHSERRYVLQNGYHRACALLAAGITHVPCIIQTVTRRDELAVAASRTVFEEAAFYFRASRPPLLKDFFDPRISKVIPVRRTRKAIEVQVQVQEYEIED